MSATISTQSNWYTNAYGGSLRTSRLRASSLLPQARLNYTIPIQQTLVIDAVRNQPSAENKDDPNNFKRRETIFGPDVGEDDEPGWTKPDEGATVDVDTVKQWVEKAKSEDGLHATTTLQALVNLKRPTLLLQHVDPERRHSMDTLGDGDITPVNDSRVSIPAPSMQLHQQPLHLLKFNYDATTPLVNITLSIYPTPPPPIESPDGKSIPSIAEQDPKVVYSGTHQGGFNQVFNLPADAAIDLSSAIGPMINPGGDSTISFGDSDKDLHNVDLTRESMGNLNLNGSGTATPDLATVPEVGTQTSNGNQNGRSFPRRFGIFPRRNRGSDPEAGEIELENRTEEKKEEDKEPEKGMRLLIRLEGVGEGGVPLKRRNAQLTHILISGMWSPDNASATNPGGQLKQVWVVKVVRREAVIGSHTFLLKEIYGLSSANQQPESTTYPPAEGAEADPYSSTPNECIVCLTSPRDVVLLPCRHLVVCRECAVGMVEFGAGGKVGRRDDPAAEGEGAAAATGGAGTGAATPAPAPAPPVAGGTTATGRERRKKKAKGWYCPVCRQPYTSLLRLALPTTDKPETTSLARVPSRAQSIRSVRTTNTIPPTLPAGAERMLENLRPAGADDIDVDDDEDEDDEVQGGASTHPHTHDHDHGHEGDERFAIGADEAEDGKGDVEHREGSSGHNRSNSLGKGWREA